jgi:hypothetical protein
MGRAGSGLASAPPVEADSSASTAIPMRMTPLTRPSVPHVQRRQTRFSAVQLPAHRCGFLVVVAAVALAGCAPLDGDSDEPVVPAASLPGMVLQPEDLPPVFSRFDEGPLAIADATTGDRADPERFGRTGGWKARYRRQGSAGTRGPLVVESRADLFGSSDGAESELDAHVEELELQVLHPSDTDLVEVEDLGDEAVALTQASDDVPGTIASHTIAWRFRNTTASVSANGFSGRLRLADVLELARAQQRRLAAATASDDG